MDAKLNLGKTITDLIIDENKQKELAENIGKLAITDSADRIAEEIIKLINKEP
jgi:hypothetical protein